MGKLTVWSDRGLEWGKTAVPRPTEATNALAPPVDPANWHACLAYVKGEFPLPMRNIHRVVEARSGANGSRCNAALWENVIGSLADLRAKLILAFGTAA